MSERRTPEAQFQLANERTYLAWLRTALALVASGVAAARLLAGPVSYTHLTLPTNREV